MLLRSFYSFLDRLAGRSRRISDSARRTRRVSFGYISEQLERRITPAANIVATGVSVVAESGAALSTISAGEIVSIDITYQTTDLPANAAYSVTFNMNGHLTTIGNGTTTIAGNLTEGAGLAGTHSYHYWAGDFDLTPGANQISAIIDPTNTVAESSYSDNQAASTVTASLPAVGTVSYTAEQIRTAYGVNDLPDFVSPTNQVSFADGTGQTIAIVDAYNDPEIFADLDKFDNDNVMSANNNVTFAQLYGSASSFISVYNQSGVDITSQIANSGVGSVPAHSPSNDDWIGETTLDVEWAHAIAPGAHIDLIETNDDGKDSSGGYDLIDGVAAARLLPGVSVVSTSWSLSENNASTATQLNTDSSVFTTPAGHTGITFLASAGDDGQPGGYPAYSPNVVAVGGTEFTVDPDNGTSYGSETGWSFPAPTQTVSFGSPNEFQTGNWTAHSEFVDHVFKGFTGAYVTANAGASASTTWTATTTGADKGYQNGTEVSVTWVPSPTNATNATYTIYDDSNDSVLGTVTVDQTKAPVGTMVGNTAFQELGVYFPESDNITNQTKISVVLSANTANGSVSADTVGFAPAFATGGGQSIHESEPDYQILAQHTGTRTIPDVSFDASENSGVTSSQAGQSFFGGFGTSLAAPCWAGIMAIVDQGRTVAGAGTLNSSNNPQQALTDIYSIPQSDFHDITTGYNGHTAGPGYDEVTGRGTPITNLVVGDLVNFNLPIHLQVTGEPPSHVTAGVPFQMSVTAEYSNGAIDSAYDGPVTMRISSQPGSTTINGDVIENALQGVANFNFSIDQAGSPYVLQAIATGFLPGFTTPVTVDPGVPYVVAIDSGGPYNGNPYPATAIATAFDSGIPLNGTFAYTFYAGSTVNPPGTSTAPYLPGTYTVVANFTSSDPNSTNGISAPVTFTITGTVPVVPTGPQVEQTTVAPNGTKFVLSTTGGLYSVTAAGIAVQLDTSVTSFSVGKDGTLFYLDSTGQLFSDPPTGPDPLAFSGVTSFAVASNGTLYFLDHGGRLFSSTTDGNSEAQVFSNVSSFLVANNNTLFFLDNTGRLYSSTNTGSNDTLLFSNVSSFAVAPNSTLYFLDNTGRLYSLPPNGAAHLVFSAVGSFEVAPDGTLYFLDTTGRLYSSTTGGTSESLIFSGVSAFQAGSDGTLYFLDVTGRLYSSMTRGTSEGLVFSGVIAFQVGPKGTLYFLDVTGRLYSSSTHGSSNTLLFSGVSSFAVASNGSLYFLDTTGRLFGLTPTGTQTLLFSGVASIEISSNGTLYFLDVNGRLYDVTTAGVQTLLSTGVSSFVVSANGTIYFLDITGRLFVITTTGVQSQIFSGVNSIAIAANGTLYFLDVNGRLWSATAAGNESQLFSGVTSIAVASNGTLYFLDSSGRLWSVTISGTLTQLFSGVTSVAVGPNGAVYFLDNSARLWIATAAGAETQLFSGAKSFVVDPINGTLYFLDSSGRLWSATTAGSESQLFSGVKSIAIGSNGTLYFLDSSGRLWSATTGGSLTQLFSGVTTFAVGPNGTLYFLDSAGRFWSATPSGTLGQLYNGVKSFAVDPVNGTVYFLDTSGRLWDATAAGSEALLFSGVSSYSISSNGTVNFQVIGGSNYTWTITGVLTQV